MKVDVVILIYAYTPVYGIAQISVLKCALRANHVRNAHEGAIMTDSNEQKKIERLRKQYGKIVPKDYGYKVFDPAVFVRPTMFHDDRPAVTRTYAGV